ncbi:sensor histidine kinase [Pseudaminobacter soli (ex Li et al. 2025)]|uniref:sensor histidine kinase n=1 Tax=Pseudaminobacter soli (ex Li et al. 2025) TaxID=1295366 RepID=UPI002475BDAD|nr:HAMP domain-containing sensor histidine kinase [Mesorhizobium soli]
MTRRLMRWLIGVAVLFWLAAAGLAAFVMYHEYQEVFDSALQETTQRLVPIVVDDLYQRGASTNPRRIDEAALAHKEHLIYQARDANGQVLLHSHDAPQQPFDVPLVTGFHQTATHRIYTEAALSGTLFLQVADPLEHRREAMRESAFSLLVPVLPLAPLSLVVIWLVVRQSLKPIGSFTREIAARDSANLSPIEVETLPTELGTIASSVNHLLARLRDAINAEREFTANAAHELRTPIAGALAQVQRLALELPTGGARIRAHNVETSLMRLTRLTEKLLQLARAEAGIGLAAEAIDLAVVIRLVAAEFERSAEGAGRIVLDMEPSYTLTRRVDVDAFAIVLRNLIENALIHGTADDPVTISIKNHDTISVSNSGPTVSPEELEKLTARFQRASANAKGTGLGLSIAATLARQMGGALDLRSPRANRSDGFEALLTL